MLLGSYVVGVCSSHDWANVFDALVHCCMPARSGTSQLYACFHSSGSRCTCLHMSMSVAQLLLGMFCQHVLITLMEHAFFLLHNHNMPYTVGPTVYPGSVVNFYMACSHFMLLYVYVYNRQQSGAHAHGFTSGPDMQQYLVRQSSCILVIQSCMTITS